MSTKPEIAGVEDYQYGFHERDISVFTTGKGINREVVETISRVKGEPEWMRDFRLHALDVFLNTPLPKWGADLSGLKFDEMTYFVRNVEQHSTSWDEVPHEVKDTFDRIGLPEAEKKFLGGVSAQYDSEVVYQNIRKDLEDLGVIFLDTDSAVRECPEIVRQYFGTVVAPEDNKLAALNSAVWSGGSFVYVPKGVQAKMPLQAYFRINASQIGQFERTLIIVEDDGMAHYVEGCTAPIYAESSMHAAVTEVIIKKGGRCRYTSIQNWAPNVYNLVTKRAVAHENATMEWVDGNIGSCVTMKYPSVYMVGEGAHANILSIAVGGKGQHQDAGAKVLHLAPRTTSSIISKSISRNGGRTTYRGSVYFGHNVKGSKAKVNCDTLIFDDGSKADTIPDNEVLDNRVTMEHEATVSKVSEEQLFYLKSRGLTEEEATNMIVMGFIEPFTRELPMEYAIEMNRLIKLDMAGSVG